MKRNSVFSNFECPCGAPAVRALIKLALDEDVGAGDATTLALVPESALSSAVILPRSDMVVAGGALVQAVFRELDSRVEVEVLVPDGARATPGRPVMAVRGPSRALLTGERTALNFLQRLSGIATLTARFVDRVRPCNVLILDTRKTTPGLRALEKYAVACGGGHNHRMGLHDRVLIKDNHLKLWRAGRGSFAAAVREARRLCPGLEIEIEVESESELKDAVEGRPDWILLDNMSPGRMRRCVEICAGRCKTEASGGITLRNVGAVAAAGVDAISLGCLTHSAPAADLSMEFDDPGPR